MRHNRKLVLTGLSAAVAAALYITCANTLDSGTATETGKVASMLYNPNGTPAKNAKVIFYPVNYNPHTGGLGKTATAVSVDSTTTDTNGNFAITLPVDTYTMEASGNSGLAFQDSVKAVKDSTVRPHPDTLQPAGSIKGVVRLEENGDPTTVFILFMGTRTFTMPDDTSGSFTSDSMAAGTYRVRILTTTPNYKTKDTVLNVTAGTVNVLSQPIVLQYTGIPTPKNLQIQYDTLKQIVTLTWDSANASLVSSYNVYRRNVGLNTVLARINTSPVTGTVYRDSSGVQDSTYEYQVAAVNAGASEGTKSTAVSVIFSSSFNLFRTLGNGQGTGNGQFNGLRSLAVDSSGNIFCVDNGNNRIQVFDSIGTFLRQWGTLGSDSGQFDTPEDICIDSIGNIYVSDQLNHRIQKFSNRGAFVSQWGSYGSANGEFNIPYAIASWSNALFVGEAAGQRVQKFDLNGNFILSFSVGRPVSGLAVIDSIVFLSADSLILRYTNQGTLIDTLCMPPVMTELGGRPGVMGLYARDSMVYYSTTVTGGEDAVFGVSLAGERTLKYLCISESGTPEDIFVSNKTMFVSFHDGYVREYHIK